MSEEMIAEARERVEQAINERLEWDGGQSGVELQFEDAKALLAAAYNPNERLREAAIHLRRSGDDAIVSVILADGREVDLIRERADGNFSHIIEPIGITRAVEEAH